MDEASYEVNVFFALGYGDGQSVFQTRFRLFLCRCDDERDEMVYVAVVPEVYDEGA